jgi:Striatin family
MMQQSPQSAQQRLLNGRDNFVKDANLPSNFSLGIQSPEYTLPGVLHFLQQEWRRFERERNEWEIEKAEYKVSYQTVVFISNHVDTTGGSR